jgi:uncharacterized protein (DUF433 family)
VKGEHRGAYPADRAAALSGVPRSTIHYWARTEILVPSVSATRVKLWSYFDLMGLRTIYWLRQSKTTAEGDRIPATSMPAVRRALGTLRKLDLDLWTENWTGGRAMVKVDRQGHVFFDPPNAEGLSTAHGQRVIDPEWLDLIAPFSTGQTRGPDLYAPRPSLRIIPGKLSGSPHIEKTRIETIALAALEERGLSQQKIAVLYPIAPRHAIREALDLEHQLQGNLRAAA